MKKILLILLVLFSNQIFAQKHLDKKIDVGIELYQNGKEAKALKVWKEIEEKAKKPSSTYGTTLGNILYFYIQNNDEINMLEYYQKIINSDLNDKDENHEIGKPYKNYRYSAIMRLVYYYGEKGEFKKGLSYIEIADNDITFETTSLTSFIFQKVDLAFWKYRFLNELGEKEKAVSKLIERAFEYDYQGMYPNWATFSSSNNEYELAETICSEFENLEKLKSDIDIGIANLTFDKKKNLINFRINRMDYEIKLYADLENKEQCKAYLQNSIFYQYLTDKTKK